MGIPLPALMRRWRMRDFARRNPPLKERLALRVWAFVAKRPRLYHALASLLMPLLAWAAGHRGSFHSLPFLASWTGGRDFPAPQGKTFQQLYADRNRLHGNIQLWQHHPIQRGGPNSQRLRGTY